MVIIMNKIKNNLIEKSLRLDKLTLGVCYYPEHWPETLWENDLDRMLELGIEVVRIAEFAWNKFEPKEGVYTFDFFDGFLELAHKKGMKIIFCTPTATPPAWLSHKYPEVLNAREDGVLYQHGMRRHYTYNSPIYQEFTKIITEKLASHYCDHPAIIGWQIDNEFNCEKDWFYSASDHAAFRVYLKEKFEDLDKFNEAMGTVFWNQTYTSWDEVHLTRPTPSNSTNPHLALEEKRFISYSTIRYCKLQADIIKKYTREDQFITTNSIFEHMDCHEMTNSSLDFMTYDSYPNFAYDTWTSPKEPGNINDRRSSWSLTRARSISPVFGIMEQQSGPGGWDSKMKQPAPRPGQMRLWTYQSVAHGADFISYFRWRTCWVGTEIYWHGLNDYSNEPNRRLKELSSIRDEFNNLVEISGAHYQADIAFVKDYSNTWDGEQDKWHGPLDSFSDNGWFVAAQLTHTPMDFLYLQNNDSKKTNLEDLVKYKLLIYPHATILTQETALLLESYVEQGGTLIMGSRTGYKDEYGRCPMQAMPGYASKLCGVKVVDYTHLSSFDDEEYALWDGEEIDAPIFNDILKPLEGARVLATFKGNYYDKEPALVCKTTGKGTAYYYGAGFSVKTAEVFLRKLGFVAPYNDVIELPREAEIAIRRKNNQDFIFVLNYMAYSIKVNIKKPMFDLIKQKEVHGMVELDRYDVMVLKG